MNINDELDRAGKGVEGAIGAGLALGVGLAALHVRNSKLKVWRQFDLISEPLAKYCEQVPVGSRNVLILDKVREKFLEMSESSARNAGVLICKWLVLQETENWQDAADLCPQIVKALLKDGDAEAARDFVHDGAETVNKIGSPLSHHAIVSREVLRYRYGEIRLKNRGYSFGSGDSLIFTEPKKGCQKVLLLALGFAITAVLAALVLNEVINWLFYPLLVLAFTPFVVYVRTPFKHDNDFWKDGNPKHYLSTFPHLKAFVNKTDASERFELISLSLSE